MKTREQYWSLMDRYKIKYGKYPNRVFDFISIHYIRGEYSLIAPLVLCHNGTRPKFEEKSSKDKLEILSLAIGVCQAYDLKLVDCSDI